MHALEFIVYFGMGLAKLVLLLFMVVMGFLYRFDLRSR